MCSPGSCGGIVCVCLLSCVYVETRMRAIVSAVGPWMVVPVWEAFSATPGVEPPPKKNHPGSLRPMGILTPLVFFCFVCFLSFFLFWGLKEIDGLIWVLTCKHSSSARRTEQGSIDFGFFFEGWYRFIGNEGHWKPICLCSLDGNLFVRMSKLFLSKIVRYLPYRFRSFSVDRLSIVTCYHIVLGGRLCTKVAHIWICLFNWKYDR